MNIFKIKGGDNGMRVSKQLMGVPKSLGETTSMQPCDSSHVKFNVNILIAM